MTPNLELLSLGIRHNRQDPESTYRCSTREGLKKMLRFTGLKITSLGLIVLFMSVGPLVAADKLPWVPDGFTIEKVAASPLVKHPMMAGFDDRGRLFVAASAGVNLRAHDLMENPPSYIQMLEDTNGDGTFDKSTIFADKLTLPQGALWYRGALYVASPPNIWRFEDTDDDGVADERQILVNTFLFSGNAASIHGCFLGPNGRIYWCDGRHGHEFIDEKGEITSKGKAARIFSCKPDGSDVQVFCGGGMDNPVEVDFTETGEMIGTVNILLGRPRVDTLMHWVKGGVYPRYDQQHCLDTFSSDAYFGQIGGSQIDTVGRLPTDDARVNFPFLGDDDVSAEFPRETC